MEVILLERVAKLGQMGEVVRVKDGFARNYLLPQGKALRATKDNRVKFDTMKVELEARNLEAKSEAEKVGAKLDAMVIGFDRSKKPNFSVKARQIAEEKQAVEQYGSSDSGASLGDILGEALKAKQD